MVMESMGVSVTEQEIREKSNCLPDSLGPLAGTDTRDLVQAARGFGFAGTFSCKFDIDGLRETLETGAFPIVEIRTRLEAGKPYTRHAVIVVKIGASDVEVLDPWLGERSLLIEQFLQEWGGTCQTTIIVERSEES